MSSNFSEQLQFIGERLDEFCVDTSAAEQLISTFEDDINETIANEVNTSALCDDLKAAIDDGMLQNDELFQLHRHLEDITGLVKSGKRIHKLEVSS